MVNIMFKSKIIDKKIISPKIKFYENETHQSLWEHNIKFTMNFKIGKIRKLLKTMEK